MLPHPDSTCIRAVDVERDLIPIADLIELCFAPHMDEDGREYIRHIRQAAQDPSLRRLVTGPNERVSLPIAGYLWEENGRIIGNLSLIPFYRQGQWRTMIANVAVHPDHRRRGIARALTQRALQHIRDHHVSEAWLQVRVDNPPAQNLYLSLGFQERSRRDTWELYNHDNPMPSLALVKVSGRRKPDWPRQKAWLERMYPPEVAWNLGFDSARLTPNVFQSLARWLENSVLTHWRVEKWGEVMGYVTWEAPTHSQGMLWLAPDPACEEEALLSLLTVARRYIPTRRTLSLNVPAGQAPSAYTQAGFTLLNTLIWMSVATN